VEWGGTSGTNTNGEGGETGTDEGEIIEEVACLDSVCCGYGT
jgi:hypothetical protein